MKGVRRISWRPSCWRNGHTREWYVTGVVIAARCRRCHKRLAS